ncbi:MAG: hypothetical protein AB7P99_03270 [Vicinamibacterales bacterium]
MRRNRIVMPVALLVVGLAGVMRFLPNVRTVDAVGLVACGALIGVSLLRLAMAARR